MESNALTDQHFSKNERLCNKVIIDRLFERGSEEVQSRYLFPFKIFYIYDPTATAKLPQVLFSVSKRGFKRAVDRNLLKRRCREAYRLHKSILVANPSAPAPSYIAFVYIAKEKANYSVIEKAMKKLLVF